MGSVLQDIAVDPGETGLLPKGRFKAESRALLAHKMRQMSRKELDRRGKRSGPGGGAVLESRGHG